VIAGSHLTLRPVLPPCGSEYYPGTKEAHVGQAFQPDRLLVSGWKA